MSALKGKLAHADPQQYNMVQRLAYLFVMLDSLAAEPHQHLNPPHQQLQQ